MPARRRSASPDASRIELIGWALYDWANNGFATVIQTFLFAAYFTRQVAPDKETGSSYWGTATGVAGVCVALLGPLLGATADQSGRRKPWIVGFTLLCVTATACLWFVEPEPADLLLGALLVGLASLGADAAMIFYNAMLPHLAGTERVGRWSGWGWAMGYAGGLACLIIALVVFVQPEQPRFGLSQEQAEPIRATVLLVAAWYALFTLPLLLVTRDAAPQRKALGQAARDGLRQVRDTLREVRRYAALVRFLIARLIYIDGLATLFVFGGVFASGTFDMTEREVLYFGIALNVTAGLGALGFSWIDEWAGSKPTILVSLVGLAVPGTLMLLVGSPVWTAFFGTSDATYNLWFLELDRNQLWFWIFGLVLGIFVGPVQAASRSYLARAAPEELRTQMFGLYALSGKATAFLGPLLVGWISYFADSQRWGMSIVVGLFVLGFILMLTVPRPEEACS